MTMLAPVWMGSCRQASRSRTAFQIIVSVGRVEEFVQRADKQECLRIRELHVCVPLASMIQVTSEYAKIAARRCKGVSLAVPIRLVNSAIPMDTH